MRKLLIILFLMVSQLSLVGAVAAKSGSDEILEKLKKARPDFQFGEVSSTPIKGIYKSSIANGPTIYLTADGKYFFAGDFFEVGAKGLVNLGEKEMEKDRAVALSKLHLDDLVIFSPSETKAYVYVFTDVDCYYCQKLHQEMPALNELGIEVRYLAYPRAGIGSPSYRKIASAWCADNPTESLTKLKNGEDISDNVCDPNPVAEHFRLGGQLGVAGTPALVTADGQLLPGYMPADKLAEALGL
ncbi:DsbC family protein [Pseudomonadales bacterium]|nr:DsbC family protein [Pseudomonadales bacterium]